MNIKKLHVRVASVVLCSFISAFCILPAAIVQAENGQAFSISPPLIELNADPGQTVNATIKFSNISNDELLIKNQLNDFGASNESGEPNILF